MFKNYVKSIVRSMLKNKSFSIINLAGLTIGIACTLFILLWIQNEISYDRFHKNAGLLHRVAFTYRPLNLSSYYQPGALSKYLKSEYPEITHSSFVQERRQKLSVDMNGFVEQGLRVEPDFLTMLSFSLIDGDKASAFTNPNSILLTQSLAQKMFGGSNPIGQSILLDGNRHMQVSGILADLPENTQFNFDYLIPIPSDDGTLDSWDVKSGSLYIQLHSESNYQTVSQKIAGIIDGIHPAWENTLFLQPLTRDHLYPLGGGGSIVYVYVFSSIAVIILLIACINFMNLSTARVEKRLKEIGVRKIVGSNRWQLIAQFLSESVISSCVATIVAVYLVQLLLPHLNNALNLHLQFAMTLGMIAGLISMALATGLVAGSYPAFYLSSLQPQKIFYQVRDKSGKHSLIRKGLVTFQFALSILFIISVFVIDQQLRFIKNKDLGFNKNNILLLETQGDLRDHTQALKDKLLKNDRITDVTVSANNLLFWTASGPMTWSGMPDESQIEFGFNWVDEDFQKTFQLSLNQGRFFSKSFPMDFQEAVVVNEAAVKAMEISDPIGKEITTFFGHKGKIIGVVKDYNTATLHQNVMPSVLLPASQGNFLCIRINSGNVPGTIGFIRQTVKEFVPDDPAQCSFLDETINRMYSLDQRTHKLVLFSAALAIFISCLGLFGLACFSIDRRIKEIGIRKVLGASIMEIIMLINMDFAKWVLLANVIAWPVAWFAMRQWLQNFMYRIHINFFSFVLAGLLALFIAIATISWQAVRAATGNQIDALRQE